MALPIQNTTTTNTFDFWKNRTNEMADAFTNITVTTDANASSVAATGNAAITGSFTANSFFGNGTIKLSNSMSNAILTTTTFYLGNTSVNLNVSSNVVTLTGQTLLVGNTTVGVSANSSGLTLANSSSNTTIRVPSNTAVANGGYYLNANGSWVSIAGIFDTISQNTSAITTSSKVVDTFSRTNYRAAEYLVSIVDNSANNRQTSKIMVTHDTTVAYVTEYGQHVSNTLLGYFTSIVSGTNVILYLQLTGTASANVKFTRILV